MTALNAIRKPRYKRVDPLAKSHVWAWWALRWKQAYPRK